MPGGGKLAKLRKAGHAKSWGSRNGYINIKLTFTMEEAALYASNFKSAYICPLCEYIHLTNHPKTT
jgi:hypothetical protein